MVLAHHPFQTTLVAPTSPHATQRKRRTNFYGSIHYRGHTFVFTILYLLQRSLLFFLDSENKEDSVNFWKLRICGSNSVYYPLPRRRVEVDLLLVFLIQNKTIQ
ncbi:hypothetical protein BDA96_04G182600 [Sorghum bicolor]|uniref:Uncharacterized protein n=2 Tax=Sorghum bicolor TaxID=4558 RepID=A0A921R4P1_SORBI|nr:hypothetical protein BDA96_04G182600 [Sorghum bicolor]KXG30411.2 hypothetical protein SORBI_3004G170032 [Sorghum bicolor]